MMREAVSLMGGYGITEDCPGFLATSGWTRSSKPPTRDPRRCSGGQLSVTMTNPVFLAQLRNWIREMRGIASERPARAHALWQRR